MRGPWPEIDLAAVDSHGAVAIHSQEGINLLGVEHTWRAGRNLPGDTGLYAGK